MAIGIVPIREGRIVRLPQMSETPITVENHQDFSVNVFDGDAWIATLSPGESGLFEPEPAVKWKHVRASTN
jgi:hypothetical protein